MKICVLGYSGSGKSTLAAALGQRLGAPVLHLDRVQFAPGWVERPLADKQADVGRFLDENADWVIDGNYTKLYFARRMEQADSIVVLAFGRWACLGRVLRRWLRWHGRTRASSAAGCPEKIDAEFLRWVLYEGRTRAHNAWYRTARQNWPAKVTVLKNQRQLDEYYKAQGLRR